MTARGAGWELVHDPPFGWELRVRAPDTERATRLRDGLVTALVALPVLLVAAASAGVPWVALLPTVAVAVGGLLGSGRAGRWTTVVALPLTSVVWAGERHLEDVQDVQDGGSCVRLVLRSGGVRELVLPEREAVVALVEAMHAARDTYGGWDDVPPLFRPDGR